MSVENVNVIEATGTGVEPGDTGEPRADLGRILNIQLDLQETGPTPGTVGKAGIVPFGASLMTRGYVVPGEVDPNATLRTPIEKVTVQATFINGAPDQAGDVDTSYDQSDPR